MKNRLTRTALVLFIASAILTAIILAKNVLIPLVVSIFIMYLMYPLVWRIEKRGVNRVISILIVIVCTIVIIGGITLFSSIYLSKTSIDINELKELVSDKIDSLQGMIESKYDINVISTDKYLKQLSDNIFKSWESGIAGFFTATSTIIFQIVILPVFTFFLLYYRTKMANFILMLSGRKNKPKAIHIMREVSDITASYVGGIFTVVFILAILNSFGLFIIGVEHAIVLGILAALLNLIPYIGTIIGGLIPILYVLLMEDNPFHTILKIIIMFIIVQFIENNLLTPNIVGNNVKINPLAIILGLLFANIVWGVAGMLVVVPCMAIAKIIMRNIDELRPFAYLISDRGMEKYKLKFNILKRSRTLKKIKVLKRNKLLKKLRYNHKDETENTVQTHR